MGNEMSACRRDSYRTQSVSGNDSHIMGTYTHSLLMILRAVSHYSLSFFPNFSLSSTCPLFNTFFVHLQVNTDSSLSVTALVCQWKQLFWQHGKNNCTQLLRWQLFDCLSCTLQHKHFCIAAYTDVRWPCSVSQPTNDSAWQRFYVCVTCRSQRLCICKRTNIQPQY